MHFDIVSCGFVGQLHDIVVWRWVGKKTEDRIQDTATHLFPICLAPLRIFHLPQRFYLFTSDFETQQRHFTQMLVTCISSLSDVVVVVDHDDFGEKH